MSFFRIEREVVADSSQSDSSITFGNLGPTGANYGDYMYWDSRKNKWAVGSSSVSIGSFAGQTGQQEDAVAIGTTAGQYDQKSDAIAIGHLAGITGQDNYAIALGYAAGNLDQRENCIGLGHSAGLSGQSIEAVAVGAQSGKYLQGFQALSMGYAAGFSTQGSLSVSIGSFTGQTNQGSQSIVVGNSSGALNQGNQAIVVGVSSGQSNQMTQAIAMGRFAGQFRQGTEAIAIGNQAGQTDQLTGSISLGVRVGFTNQGVDSVAIGRFSGQFNQGIEAISIGTQTGQTGQQSNAVAIGAIAGSTNQGQNSIAIGNRAATSAQPAGSICFNSGGVTFNPTQVGFHVRLVRSVAVGAGANRLAYSGDEIVVNSSKTFVVQHPIEADRYLVHASLEGPEAGVYYRGEGEIPSGAQQVRIPLPDYSKAFDEFTVLLTPITKFSRLATSEVEDGAFTVFGGGKFFWHVFARRTHLEVEPLKSGVTLKGAGPYRWLEQRACPGKEMISAGS